MNEAQKRYVEGKGTQCPFCGDDRIEGGHVETGGGEAHQPIYCTECNAEWDDRYKLIECWFRSEPKRKPMNERGRQWLKERLPLLQAYVDGKEMQWEGAGGVFRIESAAHLLDRMAFGRKVFIKPEPKTVPLEPEDYVVGEPIMDIGGQILPLKSVGACGVSLSKPVEGYLYWTHAQAAEQLKCWRDGQWVPCTKTVEDE